MSRVHLALNVNDIEEAVSFYTDFRTDPPRPARLRQLRHHRPAAQARPAGDPGQGGALNHLGVEVASTNAVDAEQARLVNATLAAVGERDTTCCYARQDKFWVTGAPGGERWEIYTVLAGQPDLLGPRRQPELGSGRRRARRGPRRIRPRAGHAMLRRTAADQRDRRGGEHHD